MAADLQHSRALARDAAIVASAKLAASVIVLALGFRAVSDDDYARVVIAEQWAHAPHLDPTGTSWLPLPFWVNGSVLAVLGRSLDVARGTALVLGVASSLLVWAAARALAHDRRVAVAGAVLASIFPWSARLGVATVPELPTAALVLFAAATTVPARDGCDRRLAGAAALLVATLSRYEAWPVALGFAALCAIDATRARGGARLRLGGALALALAGPFAWAAWNDHAHGSATHFLDRVAAYKTALGSSDESLMERLGGYAFSIVVQEPTVAALLGAAVLVAVVSGRSAPLREGLGRFGRPLGLAAFLVIALGLAAARDGAPTHHPERAVLFPMLLMALLCAEGWAAAVAFPTKATAVSGQRRAGIAALALASVAASELLLRPPAALQGFVDRRDEVAIGRDAGSALERGDRLLVQVEDYGYLALTAACGRPEQIVADRSIDPREAPVPSSFGDGEALARRLAASGASQFAARAAPAIVAAYGPPNRTHGAWGLWAASR